jgi:hypothetical protein
LLACRERKSQNFTGKWRQFDGYLVVGQQRHIGTSNLHHWEGVGIDYSVGTNNTFSVEVLKHVAGGLE